ncbi:MULTISPECIES: HPr family phosphocarrier protein [Spiroplasma]|uniref:Phosphocarrier protein HPr n=2 Tax=Spiroplasma TaxID=2132 RepID=S5LVH2_9MOLU|nr:MULTISPECIES: HPr family phosphocarrier protein [Spiroplasma]AGR41804.1 phosphocarrier protein Hpr [Spiroplasma diminutum CUAS-1]AUM62348.1 phosphocarrier protein Hpr [Spiroplasma monobiae MQ-1]
MTSFTATVIDPVGLHARPASVLTKEASKFASEIKIKCGDKEGNLKSIMNVMALAVKTGAEITIEANGEDENEAIEAIEKAMKDNSII